MVEKPGEAQVLSRRNHSAEVQQSTAAFLFDGSLISLRPVTQKPRGLRAQGFQRQRHQVSSLDSAMPISPALTHRPSLSQACPSRVLRLWLYTDCASRAAGDKTGDIACWQSRLRRRDSLAEDFRRRAHLRTLKAFLKKSSFVMSCSIS